MTHKQTCIAFCKEYLQNVECGQYYNSKDFEHIYRKFNGANANAWSVGVDAADYILRTAKPQNNEA